MGLLDSIMQSGQSVKRNVRGFLDAPIDTLGLLGTRLGEDAKRFNADLIANGKRASMDAKGIDAMVGEAPPKLVDQKKLFNNMMDVAGIAPVGMTAYHGSPHMFDKFDMSKIGTGEGAQAYGHGLYFAESPDVAKSYVDVAGRPTSPIGNIANGAMAEAKNNKELAISNLRKYLKNESDSFVSSGNKYNKKTIEQIEQTIKYLSDGNPGNLYKVDIPDEAIPRMLDWDKRMYEQSPDVLQKMPGLADGGKRYNQISQEMDALMWQGKLDSPEWNALKNEATSIREVLGYAPNDTGEELIRKLGGNVKAAEYLKQQGIPGIRYLDGGSRGAGQGTSNFVLFDDQLPRILERNGQPTGLLPWNPGEFK